MLAWAAATNEAGGMRRGQGNAPVRLCYYDDNSEATLAARNTQRLIRSDGVQVLLGPYSSELMLAAASLAARSGRVIWNHGGASDAVHKRRARVVGVSTPASRYFSGFPSLALRINPGGRSIVCLHRAGSGFGRRAAQGALVAARQLGMDVAVRAYRSLEDIPKVVKGLGGVDYVLAAGSFQEDVRLGQELLRRGLPVVACGLVAAGISEFRRALGDHSEGFLASSQWEPSLRPQPDFGPQPSEVAARVGVDYPAAQAYAACLLAQHCLEGAGGWEDDALWRTACRLDCTTFFGRYRIDPRNGLQVGHQMVWVQWQKGNKAIVWPPQYAQADPLPLRQVGQEVD
jgi:branched-chain amino acid transport system substrate-binding protein